MSDHSDAGPGGRSAPPPHGSQRQPPILIFARMSSRRFPGKALHDVRGKPLLQHVVDACRRSALASEVVVATSDEVADQPLRVYCAGQGIPVATGPLQDVAGRALKIAREWTCPTFLRISGDSPFIDPAIIDFAIQLANEYGTKADVITNVFPRTFPQGQSVEAISTGSLERLLAARPTRTQREHVTMGFYQGQVPSLIVRNFTVHEVLDQTRESLAAPLAYQDARLTVDTEADLPLVEYLIDAFTPRTPSEAGWLETTRVALEFAGGQGK